MSKFRAPLVGMHFRPPAKAILQVLPSLCPLIIEPEPGNQYDPNAMKVILATSNIPPGQHSNLELLAGGFGWELSAILSEPSWHLAYIDSKKTGKAAELAAALTGGQVVANAWLEFDEEGKPLVAANLEPKS